MDPAAIKPLTEAFAQSLSPNPAQLKQAEAFLKEQSQRPGYAILVLQLLSTEIPVEIRQAAAVSFKNFVKYHWVPRDDDLVQDQAVVQDSEKDQIRGNLTGLMLSTPPVVRAQLSEALAVISRHDFPARWPSLLPDLIHKLQQGGRGVLHGVLETANSIFKRYRDQYMSPALSRELELCEHFVQPLLDALTSVVQQLGAAEQGDGAAVRQLLLTARLALRIFFSMNSPGLTPAFEKTLQQWMEHFHTLLVFSCPALGQSAADVESPLDAVKAAVCQNINLFISMNEEEFAPFLPQFAQAVWTQLVSVSLRPGQDNLAMAAIRFLNTVAAGVHSSLFNSEASLRQVCEHIVLPNLGITDDLMELFEMNWVEYIRRDTEGSDHDTRRRAATDLVRSLTAKFPAEVTQLFSAYVGSSLQQYAQAPAQNWRAKDTAVYLVVALTGQGHTRAQEPTATNQLVNVLDFFGSHIVPELQRTAAEDDPGAAVLKADAIKFLTAFRGQVPKATCVQLLPSLVQALGSPSNVVHSHAAICIERLLASKEGRQPRFTMAEVAPVLNDLLQKLFGAFSLPDSRENEYIMRCVTRVITFVGAEIAPVAQVCLQQLAALLLEVCKNPMQPTFNHYMFESVAALIRHTASRDASQVANLEQQLFPAFQEVLQNDVQEFHPYVFQVFAQLIELRPAPLPGLYLHMFPGLLSPTFWERPGNIPALVRLLQAYLAKGGEAVVQNGRLVGLLGVFQKLIASKVHDHEGFFILNSVVEFLPEASFQQYLPTIFQLLFQRLAAKRTPKFTRGFVIALALFVAKHGGPSMQAGIDSMQPGLFGDFMSNVWGPALPSVSGRHEVKLVVVATTKVLCECSSLQQPDAAATWGKLLQALLAYLDGQSTQGAAGSEADADEEEPQEGAVFGAAYARLANAAREDPDPLPEVQDPSRYLASALEAFSKAQPGVVRSLLQSHVQPDMQARLQTYCATAGVTIA